MLAIFWNCEIFESDISPPQMTENKTEKKLLWKSTSNRGQNKMVHQIGLIDLSWSQRNYSVLVPFLNSLAV